MERTLLLLGWVFAVFTANSQQVSTLLSNGSNLDDCVFRSSSGVIYTSSFEEGKFGKFENGIHTVIADSLLSSNGIAEDSKGNIYVVAYGKGSVYKYDTSGNFNLFVNGLINPSGLIKMVDSDTLIVTSYTRDSLYKIAPDSTVTPFVGGTLFDGPVGMAYDTLGNLYVGNFDGMQILKITPQSDVSVHCTLPGSQQGFIAYAGGYLYGTVMANHEIYKIAIDTVDSFTLFSGNGSGYADGHADTAKYYRPNGITASPTGDTLYISEFNVERLRMITGVLNPSPLPPPVDGVATKTKNAINVYPVPTRDVLYVSGVKGSSLLNILGLDGKIAKQLYVQPKNVLAIDLLQLPKGTYYLQLEGQYISSFIKE